MLSKGLNLHNSGGLVHKLKIKFNCKILTPDAMVKLAGREKSRCWHGERKEVVSTEDGFKQRKLNLKTTFFKGLRGHHCHPAGRSDMLRL